MYIVVRTANLLDQTTLTLVQYKEPIQVPHFQVKTSYCHNRAQFPLDKIVPTVGLNVGKIATQGVKLTLWDMGGQVRYQEILSNSLLIHWNDGT